MKKAFTIGLIGFWVFTGLLLVAGMVVYTMSQPSKNVSTVTPGANETSDLNDLGGATNEIGGVNFTTELRTVEKQQYMTAELVQEHNSEGDCWLIIDGKVYEVTEYIPFHPGGSETIVGNCGADATAGYNDKDGNGTPHSAAADVQLKSYLIAAIGDPWGTITVTEEVQVPVGTIAEVSTDTTAEEGVAQETQRKTYEASTPANAIKFGIGQRVTSAAIQKGHKKPSVDSETIMTIQAGTNGEILAGPLPSNGYWWYLIKYSDGTNAWSIQDYLAKAGTITVTPQPAPTPTPVPTPTPTPDTTNQTTNNDTSTDTTVTPPDYIETCDSFSYGPWSECFSNGIQQRTVNYGIPRGCKGGTPEATQSCDYTAPVNTCTDFTYSSWSDCQPDGTQSRNVESSSPSGCTGGSPDTERSCTYVPPVVTCTSFTYTNWGACQSNNTQSRTVTSASPTNCTGGSPDTSQSCTYVPPVVTCTSFTYTSWGTCQTNNTQSRTVTGSSPSNCTGGSPQTTQSCTYVPPTCTSFSYSSWGACQSNNTQSRSVTGSSPSGCTGGSPQTTQYCTYVPPNNGLTVAEVATHNSSNDCWLIINDKAYNVTDYIPYHPGGENTIINACGKESTALFTGNTGGHRHSGNATSQLNNYYVDDVN